MINRGKVSVLEGIDSPNVLDICVALLVDGVEAEEIAEDFVTVVQRSVVDDYDLVVGVILGEDGVKVGLDTESSIVVKRRHQDTHG